MKNNDNNNKTIDRTVKCARHTERSQNDQRHLKQNAKEQENTHTHNEKVKYVEREREKKTDK